MQYSLEASYKLLSSKDGPCGIVITFRVLVNGCLNPNCMGGVSLVGSICM